MESLWSDWPWELGEGSSWEGAEVCLTSSKHLCSKRPQGSHSRAVSIIGAEGGWWEAEDRDDPDTPNFPLSYHLGPVQSSPASFHCVWHQVLPTEAAILYYYFSQFLGLTDKGSPYTHTVFSLDVVNQTEKAISKYLKNCKVEKGRKIFGVNGEKRFKTVRSPMSDFSSTCVSIPSF